MRHTRPRSWLVVVSVALLMGTLGGCSWIFGGEDVSPELARSMGLALSGAAGSAAEEPITGATGSTVEGGGPGVAFQLAPEARAAVTEKVEIDNTQDCDVSGTVHFEATGTTTYDTTGSSATYAAELEGEFTPDDCTERMDDGRTVTITASSPLQLSFSAEFVLSPTSRLTYTLDYEGTFEWDVEDGASGTCEIDVYINVSEDDGTVEGTVCGHDITASGLGG